jgi:iron complex outermembrane receptor protein
MAFIVAPSALAWGQTGNDTILAAKPGKYARASAAAQSHKSAVLESVIVTGSRVRPLQHGSVSATVFTSRDIERAGIKKPMDFMLLSPGVSMTQGDEQSKSQITIRGVTQTFADAAESPVSVIIDGVPQFATRDFNQAYYDLQSIEVVKGPQNAIYGRNAVGGAVIITTQPPPDEPHASVTAGASNGNGYNTVLKVAGPILPNVVTGSLVGSEDYFGGIYKNITTDEKIDQYNNHSLTGRVFITPNQDLTIDLKAGWASLNGGGLAYRAQLAGDPYYTGHQPDVNNTSEPYVADLPNNSRTLKNSASMRIDYQLPFGKISSVSAYSFNKDVNAASALPYLPAPTGPDDTQNSTYSTLGYFQEVKYISDKVSGLRFQVGADYYDFTRDIIMNDGYTLDHIIYEDSGPYPANSNNPTTSFSSERIHTKAWELFAEATYDITDKLILDGAARFTRDDITDSNLAPLEWSSTSGQVRDAAYSKFEPRMTLTYKISPDANIYADYSLGSLPGGFNAAGSTATVLAAYPNAVASDIYRQEKSRNFEIGFNSQWLDHRITLNGAAYYDITNNQQYETFYPQAGVLMIDSIDRVRTFGGEMQLNIIPAHNLTISFGLGLIDAKIEAFAADPTAVGNRPLNTPDFNFAFTIDKSFRITDTISGFTRFDDTVKGTEYWEPDNIPGARTNAINLANLRAGVKGKNWSATAYVTNLGDNRYFASNVVLGSGLVASDLAPPRIYGIEVTVGF